MLSALGLDDAVGYLGEVGPDYVRTRYEGIEGLPGDEGGCTPCAQGAGDIPGVGRHEAHLALGDSERASGHPVGGWCRLEAFCGVGGEDLLEPVRKPSVLYLGLRDLLRRVGQGC